MLVPSWQKPQLVVVVGIDFSRESESALETACGIARGIGRADIHAVYGASLAPLPYSLEAFAIAPQLDVAEERRRLDELCARAAAGQRTVRHVVLAAPDRAIVGVAIEQHADLIVVGTHGKSTLNRLVTGSVVDRIVRTAPCSVLVTKDNKERHVDGRHDT
jgi:nucleotide-binding universal stress UspA family protein